MIDSYSFQDETTPLLLPNNNIRWDALLPSISETALDEGSPQLIDFKHSFRHDASANDNDHYTVPLPVFAFELLVILYHLKLHNSSGRRLEEKSITVFREIVDAISPDVEREREFGALLLYRFRASPSASQRLCLLELLHYPQVPEEILTNALLTQTITTLWQTGFTRQNFPLNSISRVQKLDNIIRSPRNIHCMHLILHISYLVSLSHLVLYLPYRLLSSSQDMVLIGLVAWIGLYSISNLIFNFELSTLLLPLTAIFSVVSKLRSLPHILLLVTLSIHIIRMHFLGLPSHLLYKSRTFLPISAFFVGCIRYSLAPSLIFLLPMIVAFMALLSLSLSGALLTFSGSEIIINASPLSIRTGFLFFLALSVLMLVCLFGALLVRVSNSNTVPDLTDWDKYGSGYGIAARRFFVQAIIKYSTSLDSSLSLSYPPPFNLLEYLLVPLGKMMIPRLDHGLWYLAVGPFAFVTAGIWLWGVI